LKIKTTTKNCLIYYRPAFNDHYPFINCTMRNISAAYDRIQNARDCNVENPINIDEVIACANGPLGNQLLYAAGRISHSFRDPLSYVPSITADNAYSSQIQNQTEFYLYDFVCNQYDVRSCLLF
jgi:hypothetical protein